jgi:copper/silver efflux system protein
VIAWLMSWSARHPRLVLAVALALAATGEAARRSLAHDAVPDLSDPQIAVVAEWMDHPASEMAEVVTRALTASLQAVPGAIVVRGASMTGMAYIDVVFAAAADLEAGRAGVLERVAAVGPRLPPDVRVQVGPLAAATGWVYQYALVDSTGRSLATLRRWHDDTLRTALAALPGVAEVASVGAGGQQIVVRVRPDQLRARAVAFSDVADVVRSLPRDDVAAEMAAADKSARHGRRDASRLSRVEVPVPSADGASAPRLGDLAHVMIADDMPTGLADLDGQSPAVGGIVVLRRGADALPVIAAVKTTLEQLSARLPPGVRLVTVYDRSALIERVDRTLLRALAEEIAVVVLVILVFLLHGRSALVPLATLPFVLLLTFAGMWLLRIPATFMSLGGIGIALGIAVDADVVALEACHRRLETGTAARRHAIVGAAVAFAPAILTSLLITALSFLPVFAFTGETGRLLRPMAFTKILVVFAAAVAAVTLAPALRDRLLRGRVRPELDNPLTRRLVSVYRPFVQFALRRPALTLVTAALAVMSCVPIASRLGGEFLPRFDEGDLLYMPTTAPGVTPGDAAAQLARQDRALRQHGEVAMVFGKVGRADSATDPAPFSMAETTIRLRPRSEWPTSPVTRWYSRWAPPGLRRVLGRIWPESSPCSTTELVTKLDRAVRLPGWTNAWTAPARARMDMLSTGVRTPVALEIVAEDPARLETLGAALRAWALGLPGTRSAVSESILRETRPIWQPDARALAQHHVDPAAAEAVARLLLTGGAIGEARAGTTSYRLRLGVAADISSADPGMDVHPSAAAWSLADVTVRSSADTGRQAVPLALLGELSYAARPAMIRTDASRHVAYLHIDLDDRTDVGSYVRTGQRALAAAIASNKFWLEPGERIEWAGQYQLLAAGERRLRWVAPLVLISMLALLLLQFRNLTEALIVLVAVPFALVGSLWTLWLLDYSLSPLVWVGLLSTAGLAMQTGVVMVVYIDAAFYRRVRDGRLVDREDIIAAHAEGTVTRLRPKIMTVTTMAAGLLPLLWADGAGVDVMRRVAAPMLGGLVTSIFLTLEVLPVLYTIWRQRQLRQSQRTGKALTAIVGLPPSWARQ